MIDRSESMLPLVAAGNDYDPCARFFVEGYRGPLVAGEVERATAWSRLALKAVQTGTPVPPSPTAYGD